MGDRLHRKYSRVEVDVTVDKLRWLTATFTKVKKLLGRLGPVIVIHL